ncbi:MAG TPA: hypothetical protein VGH39_15225 [Xanthobacteraceae bacterium]
MTMQPSASDSPSKREGKHEAKHEAKNETKTSGKSTVVVELSRVRTHEQVRRLRRGRGRLATDIEEVISELAQSGTIKADTPPVVIVVRESTASLLWSELEHDLDEDEDEDDDYDEVDEDEDDEDDD